MSYGYFDTLPEPAKQRCKQKLDFIGVEECPYRFPGDTWENDPTQWPDVTYPDIYTYLIDTLSGI